MIRPARPDDCEAIHGLIRELAEFEKLLHQVEATPESLNEALFGERPTAEALVAEVDGTVVAYAIFFHNFSTFAGRAGLYLEDLYVQPDHRGTGIGKALIAEYLRIAKERNCPRAEWMVLDWNQRAIDLYEGLGAELLSEWRLVRLKP